MNNQDYDFGVSLSEVEDNDSFSPIPPGDYEVRAEQVSLKDSKSGNGKYLAFEFVIADGQYRKRKMFQNVIVEHTNEDAKRIGLQLIKSWIVACNGNGTERLTLSLIVRFLNQPCMAAIVIEPGRLGYSDKNKITRFKQENKDQDLNGMPF